MLWFSLQVSLIVCAAFLLAWSLYTVISMWSAWGYQVPPLNGILASLFAKSASFYNPFIYIGMSSLSSGRTCRLQTHNSAQAHPSCDIGPA